MQYVQRLEIVLIRQNLSHVFVNDKEWDTKEEMVLSVLKMYTQKDVWTTVTDDKKHATCKAKWAELKKVYGRIRSMSTFNTWVALTSTMLDDASLMLAQFQTFNDARTTLTNNNMNVTELQFCFILIKALLKSYSAVASTILVTGELKDLTPQKIQDQILNEEGHWSGASVSLNKIAPLKRGVTRRRKTKSNASIARHPVTKLMNAEKRRKT